MTLTRKLRLTLNLTIIFAFLVSQSVIFSLAEAEEMSGDIYGTAMGDGGVLEGAKVFLWALGPDVNYTRETVTDSDGNYYFTNLSKADGFFLELSFNNNTYFRILQGSNETSRIDFLITGRIEVHVYDTDGLPVQDAQLSLFTSRGINKQNITSDSSGFAVFTNIDPIDNYMVYLNHRQISYNEQVYFIESNTTQIEFNILESTQSDEDFVNSFLHVIVTGTENQLELFHTFTLQNQGDKVFNTSWLKGWILPEATNIAHNSMDCCIQFLNDGNFLFDPMEPLFPGDEYSVSVSYMIQFSGSRELSIKLMYDTETFNYLIKKLPEIEVSAISGVEFVDLMPYGDNEYYRFVGSDLKEGDEVSVKLTREFSWYYTLSQYAEMIDILKIAAPLGLMGVIFLYYNKNKDHLGNLEAKEAKQYDKLTDLVIELAEEEIDQEDFEIEEEKILDKAFEFYRQIQEKYSEMVDDDDLFEKMFELRAVKAVLERIEGDLEDNYIEKDVYDRIHNEYLVKRYDLEEKIKSFVPSGSDDEESES